MGQALGSDPAGSGFTRFTQRLRLEPIGPTNVDDLWLVHNDPEVSRWYGEDRPSVREVRDRARAAGDSWRRHGVGKWIAYERVGGEVVGRGGCSRTPVDDDWGRIYRFLPGEPWVRVAHENRRPFVAHANWVEIGWALRHQFWGQGYAAEIGRAGLEFAFDVIGVQAVVSCTDRGNTRSRSVMDRIGMQPAGELWDEEFEGTNGSPLAVSVVLRADRDGPSRE